MIIPFNTKIIRFKCYWLVSGLLYLRNTSIYVNVSYEIISIFRINYSWIWYLNKYEFMSSLTILIFGLHENEYWNPIVALEKPVMITETIVRTQAIAFLLLFLLSGASSMLSWLLLGIIPLTLTHHLECVFLWRQTTTQDSNCRSWHKC